MPFDAEFEKVYADLVKPALENAGYEVFRADSLANQQNILKDIVRQLHRADLVVAELTALNPNVMYELGIAHALRKRTVMITQSVEDLPFDLRSYRVISYSVRFDEIGKLEDSLKDIAEKSRADSVEFGNPVTDFLPSETTQQEVSEATHGTKSMEHPVPVESEEEKGLWDFAMEGESSLVRATEALGHLTTAIIEIGAKVTARTSEFQAIQQSGGTGSAARIYRLVELTASEILSFAQKVESELPEFRTAWDDFSNSTTGILHMSALKTPEDRAYAQQFKEMLITLSTQISPSLESMRSLRDTQSQMRGVSRSMNRAARRSTSALDQVVAEFEKSLAYTTKIIDLVDEMLNSNQNEHGT